MTWPNGVRARRRRALLGACLALAVGFATAACTAQEPAPTTETGATSSANVEPDLATLPEAAAGDVLLHEGSRTSPARVDIGLVPTERFEVLVVCAGGGTAELRDDGAELLRTIPCDEVPTRLQYYGETGEAALVLQVLGDVTRIDYRVVVPGDV